MTGTAMGGGASPYGPPPGVAPAYGYAGAPLAQQPAAVHKKSRSGLLISALVIAVLAGGGAVGYAAYSAADRRVIPPPLPAPDLPTAAPTTEILTGEGPAPVTGTPPTPTGARPTGGKLPTGAGVGGAGTSGSGGAGPGPVVVIGNGGATTVQLPFPLPSTLQIPTTFPSTIQLPPGITFPPGFPGVPQQTPTATTTPTAAPTTTPTATPTTAPTATPTTTPTSRPRTSAKP